MLEENPKALRLIIRELGCLNDTKKDLKEVKTPDRKSCVCVYKNGRVYKDGCVRETVWSVCVCVCVELRFWIRETKDLEVNPPISTHPQGRA